MSGTIRIVIAGQPWFVPTGISVAAALALTDNPITRLSVSGQPRTPFCGMGVCQECRVSVNGRRVPGCQTLCQPDMQIERSGYADLTV